MVADFLGVFVGQITLVMNSVAPHVWKTLYILVGLNIAWIGIETALGKHETPGLIEKLLAMCLVILLVKSFNYLSFTFLNSLLKLAAGSDTSILESPEQIFVYAHANILEPINNAVSGQFSNANGFGVLALGMQQAGFFVIYGVFTIAIYICFAVIVVQIVISYLSFLISMLFGLILLPFSVFKPLEFIGKNVFTAMISQALTIAVVVFVAELGLRVFGIIVTQSALESIAQRGKLNAAMLWTILSCVLIYFYLCIKAPSLVMSLISGSPTLGAGGLFSTLAGVGFAVSSMLRGGQNPLGSLPIGGGSPSGGGGSGTGGGGGSAASGSGAGQFMPHAASSSSGASAASGGSRANPSQGAAGGTFLPHAASSSSGASTVSGDGQANPPQSTDSGWGPKPQPVTNGVVAS